MDLDYIEKRLNYYRSTLKVTEDIITYALGKAKTERKIKSIFKI